MKLRSMRVRLTIAFLLVLTPFLLLSSHVVIASHRSKRAIDVKTTAKEVMEKSVLALRGPAWRTDVTSMFSSDAVKDQRLGALVIDGTGEVIWRSPNDAPSWPRPVHDHAPSIQSGGMRMIFNLPEMRHVGDREWHALIMLNIAALSAFAVAAWVLVGRTLQPIRSLAHQAQEASVDDVGTRLVSPSQDREMQELVTTLNGLLGRIEEASEEKGRFYAAASHELRTPLTALLGHLEVALGQPRTQDEYEATIQEAHVQTGRLVSLVEGILLLHQLQGPTRLEPERACLTVVVEETLETFRPLIEARGLSLQTEIADNVTTLAIPSHAVVLLRNLLENAAKYGREGGQLLVSLEQSRLRIENETPDPTIPVERLFEPFYRLDASRSAKSGGNGLGLAICRAVAKANGWDLALRAEGSMIVAEVSFGE